MGEAGTVTLTLDRRDIELIFGALSELPYKVAAPAISRIAAALAPKPEAAPTAAAAQG